MYGYYREKLHVNHSWELKGLFFDKENNANTIDLVWDYAFVSEYHVVTWKYFRDLFFPSNYVYGVF